MPRRLSRKEIDAVLDYYAKFTTEIHAEIAENVAVADELESALRKRQGLLAKWSPTDIETWYLFCGCCVTGPAPTFWVPDMERGNRWSFGDGTGPEVLRLVRDGDQ